MTARQDSGWYYLATPYTNYAAGIEAASVLACEEAGRLLDAGIPMFSPIAHFHAIRRVTGERPHEFWLEADRPFMEAACGLIVVTADGWKDSRGMMIEIEHFAERCAPIIYMRPGIVPDELLRTNEGRGDLPAAAPDIQSRKWPP